jgi:hypothetical protein
MGVILCLGRIASEDAFAVFSFTCIGGKTGIEGTNCRIEEAMETCHIVIHQLKLLPILLVLLLSGPRHCHFGLEQAAAANASVHSDWYPADRHRIIDTNKGISTIQCATASRLAIFCRPFTSRPLLVLV